MIKFLRSGSFFLSLREKHTVNMKDFLSLKDASSALFDLFLPRTCVACGRELGVHEKHLCIYCRSDIPLSYNWERTHNRMADRFNERIQEGLSPATREPYAYAACLLRYSSDSGFKEVPQSLKYRYNVSGGRYFAGMLGRFLAASAHFSDVDLVIPVPLHFLRLWKRGYNQAEVIAREVASALGAPLSTRLLYRRRYTRTQTKTAVSMKGRNVGGAFALRSRALRPFALSSGTVRHILLIDDVFTTGATLYACFSALRAAFPPPVRISVATLAALER